MTHNQKQSKNFKKNSYTKKENHLIDLILIYT